MGHTVFGRSAALGPALLHGISAAAALAVAAATRGRSSPDWVGIFSPVLALLLAIPALGPLVTDLSGLLDGKGRFEPADAGSAMQCKFAARIVAGVALIWGLAFYAALIAGLLVIGAAPFLRWVATRQVGVMIVLWLGSLQMLLALGTTVTRWVWIRLLLCLFSFAVGAFYAFVGIAGRLNAPVDAGLLLLFCVFVILWFGLVLTVELVVGGKHRDPANAGYVT